MLVTEEALVGVRKVIREELYREKIAEPSRSVSEIGAMTAKEMKRELSQLGLDFVTNMEPKFRSEIKKLASERKKRPEFNIRNMKKRLAEEKSWEKSIAREETHRKNSIAREEARRRGVEKIDRRDLNETVHQRDQRLRRNELARIRRAKKKEVAARLLDLTPVLQETALRGMVSCYIIKPTVAYDPVPFLEAVRPKVQELLDGLRGNKSRNIRIGLICLMGKEQNGKETEKEATFTTGNYKLHGERRTQIHPYVISADTESFLKKKKEDIEKDNNPKASGTEELHEHIMNSYCMKSETIQHISVHKLQCISDRKLTIPFPWKRCLIIK
ncbi:Hypothetical predicted protein [Paramuricea clavata]|uniref:Uncharacterized protein n=1 Tax=Paramuricea clavata TaxID=317549 RepID=A0A7D9HPC8_PARCT|nr:Hypothetical predicted protein [Paramuricea clavata]